MLSKTRNRKIVAMVSLCSSTSLTCVFARFCPSPLVAYQLWLLNCGKDLKGYVFVSQRTGLNLTPRGLRFMLDKYARRAGVAHLGPHDLRHRFGYRMAEKVPLHRLAQIMGHDSLDTTLTYIRATQRDLQQAVETIAWE